MREELKNREEGDDGQAGGGVSEEPQSQHSRSRSCWDIVEECGDRGACPHSIWGSEEGSLKNM